MTNDFAALCARGAPAALVEAIAAAGLSGIVARQAVARVGWCNRLRLWLNPQARLSAAETVRLEAVAALAVVVAADQGGPEGARRFWDGKMPWLGGRTPAEVLARGDIGAIEELRVRINHGIPP